MTKEWIIQRIRELAADRGGHISFRAFLAETGFNAQQLRQQEWWTTWNELLSEIGLDTRRFSVPRTDDSHIARAVAAVIEREECWPTEDALARERKRDHAFPSLSVVRRLRKSGALEKLIIELSEASGQFSIASMIAKKRLPIQADNIDIESGERVTGFVYLLRSGRKYKIGKSIDPSRRYREVRLELPDETRQVHTIPTDDPTGIEKYWHERFAEKRIRKTEFFTLDSRDVQAFKRRKYQ